MEKYNLIKEKIKLHNIIFCYTSEIDYEMSRYLLIEGLDDIGYDDYILVEGYHCSCYDFDDTEWEAIKYTRDELIELAKVKINDKYCYNQIFYTMILNYFGEGSDKE